MANLWAVFDVEQKGVLDKACLSPSSACCLTFRLQDEFEILVSSFIYCSMLYLGPDFESQRNESEVRPFLSHSPLPSQSTSPQTFSPISLPRS